MSSSNPNSYDGTRGGLPNDQTQQLGQSGWAGYDPNQLLGSDQTKDGYATPVKQYPASMPPAVPQAPIQPYQPAQPPTYPPGYRPVPPQYSTPDMDAIRKEAAKAVEAKQGFRAHLTTYIFVMFILVAIWLVISLVTHQLLYFFPIWVAFGWGIGLLAHYLSVYGGWRDQTAAEKQRAIDAEVQRRMGQR